MNDIENASCVSSVMNILPVQEIEINKWGANIIILKIDDGLYIFTCTVKLFENKIQTKHAFVYESHLKQLGNVFVVH